MPEFSITLLKKEEVARNTMCLKFAKPEGFNFVPGRFITLIVPDMPYSDEKGNRRSMSIASSPTEKTIDTTMRHSDSAFKKSLDKLKPGAVISAMGPFGQFTMPEDESIPLILLAGGVGITPFRSMIKFVIDTKSTRPLHLIYCNNCMKDSAYLNELAQLAKENDQFTFTPVMTSEKNCEPEWDGDIGQLTPDFIKKKVGDISLPTYMIVGPPGMVDAFEKMLQDMKVPDERIKIEKF